MKYPCLALLVFSVIIVVSSCSRADKNVATPNPPPDSIPANNINVILIVGDDIGYEIPTCDGGQSYLTPHLDSLAENGVRFTECYSSPLCSPSRISLLTGKYNFRNYFSWGILNTNQLTLGNLFQDNGYKTYYAGKWQLDGGASSIKKFGFDDYVVWQPFKLLWAQDGSRYKGPLLYADGNYISAEALQNKYGDDVFSDSIENFISQNKQKPFFVYYAMALAHLPFSPTPDDADYAAWPSGNPNRSNTKYFPGMIKYMDKKIGALEDFLQQNKLDKNTIILFVGDNGTSTEITSQFDGENIEGGKGHTYTYGTHVPLIIFWPGKIMAGSVDNSLVSLPDFLPTLADLTHISIPASFNPIDGVSFANQLFGDYSSARNFIFNYYHYDTSFVPVQWVQNAQFKLYGNSNNDYHAPGFYDLQDDIMEHTPISNAYLSIGERIVKQNFQHVLDSLK